MNLERLDQAIAVMRRAGKVDMAVWNRHPLSKPKSEEAYHECGTAACFAGWLAVSPEFREAGGHPDFLGSPSFEGATGDLAVIKWLEAEGEDANRLQAIILGIGFSTWSEWTAQDVVRELEGLKA